LQVEKCQANSSPSRVTTNPIAGYIKCSNTNVDYIWCLFYSSRQWFW